MYCTELTKVIDLLAALVSSIIGYTDSLFNVIQSQINNNKYMTYDDLHYNNETTNCNSLNHS